MFPVFIPNAEGSEDYDKIEVKLMADGSILLELPNDRWQLTPESAVLFGYRLIALGQSSELWNIEVLEERITKLEREQPTIGTLQNYKVLVERVSRLEAALERLRQIVL